VIVNFLCLKNFTEMCYAIAMPNDMTYYYWLHNLF